MIQLETARLLLRNGHETRPTDAELQNGYRRYVAEYEDPDTPYQAYVDVVLCAYLRAKGGSVFGYYNLTARETGDWVGHISLDALLCEPSVAAAVSRAVGAGPTDGAVEVEIGWAISNLNRNQGYATEGALTLLAYCFDELKLGRVIALTERDNLASMRVMEKLGMALLDHPLSDGVIGVATQDRRIPV